VFFMAVTIGVIVANLYYLQPLLHQVKGNFRIGTFAASVLITLVQFGYAMGLAFMVPLGDILRRRRLIVVIFLGAAVAMLAGSLVHNFVLFALLTVVIGLSSSGGHVIIPFAADLADEGQRGRVVARLMTGLLLGVLLSRTFSGIVAEAVGWRGVYVIAALVLIASALVLGRVLPSEPARRHVPYLELVGGSFGSLGTFRELRHRAWIGAAAFSAFSVLWSILAFHLSAAPFHYSNIEIGLFGLLGVGGVLAANVAGRLADRHRSREATIVAALLIAGSFVLMGVGHNNVWLLMVAIFLLDLGVQGIQITNQAIIFTLDPERRSRINSAYMVCYFSGGALGSLAAGFIYTHHGWTGMCLLGLAIGLITLVMTLLWRPAPSTN
jgi:predicted MFS family arabinose efflux permease